MGATTCPGSRTARRIECGCPRSCCSRRRSRRWRPTTSASWSASPTCARSPRLRSMRCCTCGRGWAITRARATCIARRCASAMTTAGSYPASSRSSPPFPVSGARPQARSWRSHTGRVSRFSMATCGACWRATSAWRDPPPSGPWRSGCGSCRSVVRRKSRSMRTPRRSWISAPRCACGASPCVLTARWRRSASPGAPAGSTSCRRRG